MRWSLNLKSVHYGYDDGADVLRGVSLTLSSGKVYALIGPNGSGKSTLMALLGGIYEPTSGTIVMLDEDEIPLSLRSEVLVSFQNPDLTFSQLTLRREIYHTLSLKGSSKESIEEKLRLLMSWLKVDEEFLDRELDTLSYGWRRLVALAEYLVLGGRLICLDEPTANLDPSWSGRLWSMFSRLLHEREDMSILFSTHNPVEVLIADEILFMREGNLRVFSHKQLTEFEDEYLRAFLGEIAPLVASWDSRRAKRLRVRLTRGGRYEA